MKGREGGGRGRGHGWKRGRRQGKSQAGSQINGRTPTAPRRRTRDSNWLLGLFLAENQMKSHPEVASAHTDYLTPSCALARPPEPGAQKRPVQGALLMKSRIPPQKGQPAGHPARAPHPGKGQGREQSKQVGASWEEREEVLRSFEVCKPDLHPRGRTELAWRITGLIRALTGTVGLHRTSRVLCNSPVNRAVSLVWPHVQGDYHPIHG